MHFHYLGIQKKNTSIIMRLTEVCASLNTSIIHQYKENDTFYKEEIHNTSIHRKEYIHNTSIQKEKYTPH